MELVCKIPTRKQKGIKLLTDSIIHHFGYGKASLNALFQTESPTLFLSHMNEQCNSGGFPHSAMQIHKHITDFKKLKYCQHQNKGEKKVHISSIFLCFSFETADSSTGG